MTVKCIVLMSYCAYVVTAVFRICMYRLYVSLLTVLLYAYFFLCLIPICVIITYKKNFKQHSLQCVYSVYSI